MIADFFKNILTNFKAAPTKISYLWISISAQFLVSTPLINFAYAGRVAYLPIP